MSVSLNPPEAPEAHGRPQATATTAFRPPGCPSGRASRCRPRDAALAAPRPTGSSPRPWCRVTPPAPTKSTYFAPLLSSPPLGATALSLVLPRPSGRAPSGSPAAKRPASEIPEGPRAGRWHKGRDLKARPPVPRGEEKASCPGLSPCSVPNLIPPPDASRLRSSRRPNGAGLGAHWPPSPRRCHSPLPSRRYTHFDPPPLVSATLRRPPALSRACRPRLPTPKLTWHSQADAGAHRRVRARHLQDAAGMRGLPQALVPPAAQGRHAGVEHGQRPTDHGRPVRVLPGTAWPITSPELLLQAGFASRTAPAPPDWAGPGRFAAPSVWAVPSPQLRPSLPRLRSVFGG